VAFKEDGMQYIKPFGLSQEDAQVQMGGWHVYVHIFGSTSSSNSYISQSSGYVSQTTFTSISIFTIGPCPL